MEAASDGAATIESAAAAASAAAVTTSAAAAAVRSAAAAADFVAAAADENGDDDGEVTTPTSSAAASVAPMLMLRRKRSWVIAMLVIVWFSFMLARFTSVLLDIPFLYSPAYAHNTSGGGRWWAVRFSVLVGLEAGLVTVLALLVLQVPTMIIVWTTALLFDYAANRGARSRAKQSRLVRKASWMARDIFMTTTRSVLREGNLVAVVVTASCLLLLLLAGYLVVT